MDGAIFDDKDWFDNDVWYVEKRLSLSSNMKNGVEELVGKFKKFVDILNSSS